MKNLRVKEEKDPSVERGESAARSELASPRPWRVGDGSRVGWLCIEDAQGNEIIELNSTDGADDPQPFPDTVNARLIVHRVNTYEALVEALQHVANWPCDCPPVEWERPNSCRHCKAVAALAAAEENQNHAG